MTTESARSLNSSSTLLASYRRTAVGFGGFFAFVTLGNVFQSRANAAWWEWIVLPAVSFVLFGGLAYGVLRSRGRPIPPDGSIPVSGELAVAVIGVFVLAFGVPIYLLAATDVDSSAVLAPTGITLAVWLGAVVLVSQLRKRRRR